MKKLLFFFFLFLLPVSAKAMSADSYIYISGETIGIKLYTDVSVVGTFEVDGVKPWENKIKEGDIIVKVNGKEIENIEDMKKQIKENNVFTIKRDKKIIDVDISPAKVDGGYSLGIYFKDNILGVGTMTYVIPDSNEYASLGHSIGSDGESGNIYSSTVTNINRSSNGNVGEKEVEIDHNSIGTVTNNTETGIYGKYEGMLDLPMYQIGKKEDVHSGEATILTTIDGENVQEFDVKIVEVYKQKDKSTKSMRVEVVDKRLLEKAGGIVQGMSGSPIIQDGKIIGALTHVIVNDTKCGYGIYIEWMLEEMGINIE